MLEFRWVLTAVGLAKRAAAEAGGELIRPTRLAVGDGGGEYHDPEGLANLVNEVWIGPLNRVYVSPADATLWIVEAKIPSDVGGWTIREAAIVDADGDVIAIGKYPASMKPAPGSGGEKELYVRGGFRVSNGGDFVVQIDASLVMATQTYVDEHAALTAPHSATSAATANRLMLRDANGRAKVAAPAAADDIARLDTVTNSPAFVGTPTAPTAAPGTNTTQLATAAFVQAAIAALINGSPGALDTLKELADAMGDDPNFAATVTNALAGKVAHSLATAANDFLVASGPGAFVKKTLAEVQALLGPSIVPAGTVIYVAMVAAPAGYLKANGAAVSRAGYAALFAAIGTRFGAGDGATTFNLPDLRGEFVRGWDDGRGVDAGRVLGSAQDDMIKSHHHLAPTVASGGTGYEVGQGPAGLYDYGAQAAPTSDTGGAENRPRNVALLACIRF